MNILFFLKQKQDVVFAYDDETIKDVMNKLKNSRYSAIPVITRTDKYIGTLTEGDILWAIKNHNGKTIEECENILVNDIPRNRDNLPIHANEKMTDLLNRAIDENFVPLLDNKDRFIGIVTRKEIIEYFFQHNFIVL